jgi:hypothetical protein
MMAKERGGELVKQATGERLVARWIAGVDPDGEI